jgi:hypothetical protein
MANNKQKFETLYNETKELTNILESQLLTFKKNPNRTVSANTYEKRCQDLVENKNRFKVLISEIYKFNLTEKTQEVVVKVNEIFSEISKKLEEVLKNRLDKNLNSDQETEEEEEKENQEEEEEKENQEEEEEQDEEENQEIKMVDFAYSEAKSLPELKQVRNDTEVRDFLAAVEGYYDVLNANGKTALVKFVVKTKILGSAKTKIGLAQNVMTLQGLKTLLNEKCGSTETSTSLLKRLNETSQGAVSVEKFAEEVSAIADRLSAIQIKTENIDNQEHIDIIKKLYDGQALGQFKKGLRKEFQSAVCAARPSTMEDAILVATEMAAIALNKDDEASVLNIKQNPVKCFRCNKDGHFARECRSTVQNNQFRGHNRGQYFRGQDGFYVGNQNQARGQSNGQYRNQYRGQSRGNFGGNFRGQFRGGSQQNMHYRNNDQRNAYETNRYRQNNNPQMYYICDGNMNNGQNPMDHGHLGFPQPHMQTTMQDRLQHPAQNGEQGPQQPLSPLGMFTM